MIMIDEEIECPDCRGCMDIVDSTFSTEVETMGQQTGDIYYCEECEQYYLNNFKENKLQEWFW
jgi:hypothetical protein